MEWMDRFVTIMDVVSAENERGIGVTTLANETGLSKGTLYRILQDMVHYKLIVQVPETKKYYLGPRSMIWGSCFVKGRDVSTILSPFCDDIAERTQLYAYICRYVTNEVYCIYTHQPLQEHKTTYFVHVGQRMPLHASAAAKAILAHQPQDMVKYLLDQSSWQIFTAHTAKRVADLMEELETVRKEKVAWCREEIDVGVAALSVPLFIGDTAGFSLSVVGNSNDIYAQQERLCELLSSAGHSMSEQLAEINDFMPLV